MRKLGWPDGAVEKLRPKAQNEKLTLSAGLPETACILLQDTELRKHRPGGPLTAPQPKP